MLTLFEKMKHNKYIILAIKMLLSLYLLGMIGSALFIDGLNSFYNYKDSVYQNDFLDEQAHSLAETIEISQEFTAERGLLNNVFVYLSAIPDETINVAVSDKAGKVIAKKSFNPSEYSASAWNKIGFCTSGLKKDEKYVISFSNENGLGALCSIQGNEQGILGDFYVGDEQAEGNLAVGFQFTYRYLTLGGAFELLFKVIFSFLMGAALCFAVFKAEDLYSAFKVSERKRGFTFALYFSVTFTFLFNPLETIRNKVTEFNRVMGGGLVANVDVSKRISNFNFWFIIFAVAFVLFYMLSNYLLQNEKSEEAYKVEEFLGHFMILANCSLILRCITYFNDEATVGSVYSFSAYVITLIAIAAIAYILLGLDKKVSADDFSRIMMMGASLGYPIAIFIPTGWGDGRVLLGVLAVIAVLNLILCRFAGELIKKDWISSFMESGVIILPLIPLMTSLYIELIHVLNQYSVFVPDPAKYYGLAIILVFLVLLAMNVFMKKKKIHIIGWKKWAFPWFVFGVSCLSVQIPITSTYNPHVFEGANYSILISDFLNYGTVPIVQHYGGHMMESVWEGILYGLVNNDYAGAIVSPYSSLVTPVLVVLFYYLVRKIWNDEAALFVALLFPFYAFWSYFGLGMLVCLAAMAYIKKNTYMRATVLWAAFIWTAAYRLDLGFAFGLAAIISLIIYVIVDKNMKAVKELALTLIGWGIVGGAAWCSICVVKGDNPVNRLIEFLMISLSNQNWAGEGIGDTGNTLFAWSYLIVPFLIAVCLLYTIFSKRMREKSGKEKWLLLMIFGWSYFENFSRGLVRHTIEESTTDIVIWCGFIFLAMFFSLYKNNKYVFLPAFLVLILCNTLFLQDENYTAASIAESSVSKPASIIESWKERTVADETGTSGHLMTYWEKLKFDQEVVDRVKLDNSLEAYVKKYELVLDALLEEDETFVDFINKTLIYSVLGKKNPVYVSQSPLQLSGEFAQVEFIKEIAGVPIVLMPIDSDNYMYSNSLDEITNVYRNYKVAEYIYQNYVPLCRYGSDYAVWCLKERYDGYKEKISGLVHKTDYIENFMNSPDVVLENGELTPSEDGIVFAYTGADPKLMELQNVIDILPYVNLDMEVTIEYESDVKGTFQLFYTTELGESYTQEKVVNVECSNSGIASFTVPITEYSRLGLDTPEGSSVKIKSILVENSCKYIDYGYDGPNGNADANGNVSYEYVGALHNHSIKQLPRIWAERDVKDANDNAVLTELSNNDGIYTFDANGFTAGADGNYLKISASYDGSDIDGLYGIDDEQIDATVILGYNGNGQFVEKCRYAVSFKEGQHDYLIRCSTDYYWYLGEINAVRIQADGDLHNVAMKILKGD